MIRRADDAAYERPIRRHERAMLHAGRPVDDLRGDVRRLGREIADGKAAPLYVAVPGYDGDPRELWERATGRWICVRPV